MSTTTSSGTFAPDPGAAPLSRMLAAQTGLEVRMVLLTVFGSVEVMDLGNRAARVDFLVPGVLALAVMSTAFTGLAIGTGFERRYGALKRLGASPLPRGALLGAKGLAVLTIEAPSSVARIVAPEMTATVLRRTNLRAR